MRISTLAGCCTLALSLSTGSAHANDLMDVYQMTLENDPTIIASEYQRLAAEAGVSVAKSSRMPTLGATLSGGESNLHGPSLEQQDVTTAVLAELPLYNRGNSIGVTLSRVQLNKAAADHANVQQDLIRRAADGYFGLLRAQDNVAFAKTEREAIYRQLDQAERRYEVGLVAITDVKEAQASYDLSVANVISSENQQRAAEEGLRVMTNSYVKDLHVLEEAITLSPPEPNDVELWVTTAKKQSPTIIAAREDLANAKLSVQQAGAARYPSLDLTAAYKNENFSGATKFSTDDKEAHSINLQLTVPLYTGGAVSASKRQAAQMAKASAKSLIGTERDVERNVRTAFSTVEARISQAHALKRALESNEIRLEATEAGYEAGTRTAVDVLNAIRGSTSAAAQFAGARYDYILAILDLQAAVGLLGESDLVLFNDWLKPAVAEAAEKKEDS